jgi:hypothetical protein
MAGNNYIPQVGDYSMATQYPGYNSSNPSWGVKTTGTNGNYIPSMEKATTAPASSVGTALTNNDGSLTNLGIASVGMGTLQTVGNLWSAWESNALAKKQFSFNKDMAKKNYALAKDAYERRARRSDNLTRAQSGESMQNIYRDQLQYNRERADARKDY